MGRARGDSCSLIPDQLTANDTPTPASHPTRTKTKKNTTIAALLATEDTFVKTMNERFLFFIFFVKYVKQKYFGKEDTVTQTTTLT